MKVKIILLLLILFNQVACHKENLTYTNSKIFIPSEDKETEISGEAVVTNDFGETIKISDMGVYVISESEIENILKFGKPASDETKKEYLSVLSDCQKKFPAGVFDQSIEKRSCFSRADALRSHITGIYFLKINKYIALSITDRDGKFNLKIPKTGSYALGGYKNSEFRGSNRGYHWLFRIEADGTSKHITLNNDNLSDKDIPNQILPKQNFQP